MKVIPIPLLEDNYSYLIYGKNPNQALIVDPSEGKPLVEFLSKLPEIQVTNILLTHKHHDHTDGVPDLLKYLNEQNKSNDKIEVFAGFEENFLAATRNIKEKESFKISEDLKITVFPVPCHTRGHVLYFLEDINNNQDNYSQTGSYHKCLFTGDTLFLGGCGKFFEGNAQDMLRNFDLISSLPIDTYIFCGHEYTVSNLEWALGIEWENDAYLKKLEWAREIRKNGKFTVPGKIGEEFETNIFMRCRNEKLMQKLKAKEPVEVMEILRKMKDMKMNLKETSNI